MHPRGRRHPCFALRGHRPKRSTEDFTEKSCGDKKVARFLSLETGRIQKQRIQSSFDSSRSHLLAASCFGGQTGRRTPPWPCPTDEPRRGVFLRGAEWMLWCFPILIHCNECFKFRYVEYIHDIRRPYRDVSMWECSCRGEADFRARSHEDEGFLAVGWLSKQPKHEDWQGRIWGGTGFANGKRQHSLNSCTTVALIVTWCLWLTFT